MHNLIDQLNPDLRTVDNINGKKRKREFYEMTPEQAFNILKAISVITNTEKRLKKIPESKINKEEEKKAREDKRPPFKFSMVSLKKGDKVYFKNNKKKMAIIIDDTHVQYGNVTFSLSTLAQELGKFKQRPQGPAYFVDSKGKTLDELRKEKEDQ